MIRAIVTSTTLQVLSLALGMVDRIFVSALMLRVWGVGVFEDWSVLIAAASLLGFLDLGLHMTFGNTYTEAYQSGKIKLFQRRVATALWLNAWIMVLGVAVLLGLAWSGHVGAIAHTSHLSSCEVSVVFILYGAAIAIQTFSGALVTVYRAYGLYPRSQLIDFGSTFARITLTALCIALAGSPVTTAAIVLVVQLLTSLLIVPWDLARSNAATRLWPSRPALDELRQTMAIARQFYVQHAVNVALLNLPVMLVPLSVAEPGAVALFMFTRTLTNVLRQVMAALSNALGVELSRLHAAGSAMAEIPGALTRSSDLLLVVSSSAYAALLTSVDPLMIVLTNGKLHGDTMLTAILGSALVVNAPFAGVLAFLNYSGQIGHLTRSRTITIAVTVLAALLLFKLGLTGIALALALGEIAGGIIVYLRLAAGQAGLSQARYLFRAALLVGAGLLPVLVIGQTVNAMLAFSQIIILLIQLPLLGLVTLFLGYFIGAPVEYREWLSGQIRRRLRAHDAS